MGPSGTMANNNKRSRNDCVVGHQNSNHCDDHSPIVQLNVGGAKRDVRRSLLNALRDASRTTATAIIAPANDTNAPDRIANPLCDILLDAEHWSEVSTTTDGDGTVRVYLDRDARAFDDLLEYVEYGKSFLEEIANGGVDGGARLRRLRSEAGYFTVGTFFDDLEDVMFGNPISFRSDRWFNIAGRCKQNGGWQWTNVSGNESIASRHVGRGLPICEVKTSGTYLVFFSLHSVAVTALKPGHGYPDSEGGCEFCTLSVFHENMTKSNHGHWTYPLIRVGAFDYRADEETRTRDPLLFTAACAEPISLRKGNKLYCEHGTGVASRAMTISSLVGRHTKVPDDLHSVCYITLVQVFGDNISKWNVKNVDDPEEEPTIVKWTACNNDFPIPPESSLPNAYLDGKDETKICFKKAGYYLLLGRVAGCLQDRKIRFDERPTIQLELCTKGGLPMQTLPEVVSLRMDSDEPYNEKLVEYGPINDIIYAEKDSYVCVKAKQGACFASHGSDPVPFGRIATQSLSAMRLSQSARVDRYQVSLDNGKLCFERAHGSDERLLEQSPLFNIREGGTNEDQVLEVAVNCHCFVVGGLCSLIGSTATLMKNHTKIVHSQVCKGSGRGSHSFQGVLDLKENDCITLTYDGCYDLDHSPNCGHLAFVVLE